MKSQRLIGMLAGLVATNAYAFIAPTNGPAGLKVKSTVIRPNLYSPAISAFADEGVDVVLDRQSNSIRQMNGFDLMGVSVTAPTAESIEKAALDLVASRPDVFGVSAADVRLNPKGTHVDPEDQIVNLQVFRSGLRISDAGVTMRFKNGHLVSVKSETFSEAVVAPGSVTNTGDIAAKALNSQGYIARGSMWRVKPTSAGYSLVKVDEYVVAGADNAWVVQVDTTNGSLYELRSKDFNMSGKATATVYPRYFGEALAATPLPFSTVTNASARSNERGEFQSRDEFNAPKITGLTGQFVRVHTETGSDLAANATKVGGSWDLKFDIKPTAKLWDNNDMAQAMAYVNANRIITMAKKYIDPTWFNQPLEVNVNHNQHCNAKWDGDSITLFTGGSARGMTCANTGVIADVMFHEWGHGLDDNTGGIEDDALSEGFGDAMALLFTDDSKVGIDFMPLEHRPVRDLSDLKKFPDNAGDEVHAAGQIVGGAWYDMYTALKTKLGKEKAKDLYAKMLFKGIYSMPKMSDVYESMLTVDDDDGDRSNGTPNLCEINKAFVRHGLAKADNRCH
ncbi:MAG: hypothetical protein WCO71_00405 [Pseudomonadota bacterium]